MKPSIGRIVHYVIRSSLHLPAIVLRVEGDLVDLEVFGPVYTHEKFPSDVREDPSGELGTWHWPEVQA